MKIKLNDAQMRVLSLLAERGPMTTSRTTHHDQVSGSCATSLVDRHLAKVVWTGEPRTYHVEITHLGREALAAYEPPHQGTNRRASRAGGHGRAVDQATRAGEQPVDPAGGAGGDAEAGGGAAHAGLESGDGGAEPTQPLPPRAQ